jgi:protein-L-isoaspartate(D-aspartate) O-methyltransferase
VSDQARQIRLLMELRRQGINDTGVLAAIERVPRELFVPDTFKDQAYENIALPIKQGQTISQPYVVAFMTEALRVSKRMKVLEVGTGSGYQAAVLSKLCRRVYTVERYRSLLQEAEARFAAMRITNITTRVGDGMKGWPEQAPFERIVVTAAAATVPAALVDQLAIDGVMVLPLGSTTTEQEIVRVTRTDKGCTEEGLLAVRFVPLLPGVAEES